MMENKSHVPNHPPTRKFNDIFFDQSSDQWIGFLGKNLTRNHGFFHGIYGVGPWRF
jgi:hypothetical protein